jgi:hypothetical protein
MKARDFDKKFDRGESILSQLDLSKATCPDQEQRRVNVDFPTWMIQSLDNEARRLAVTRQSIIKVWIAERLQKTELASGTVSRH